MGFRTTFVTEDLGDKWPQWFQEKYAKTIWFSENGGPLSSIYERKLYVDWPTLVLDIQSARIWGDSPAPFVLVFLHECGGITRVEIYKDRILWSEPESWVKVEGSTHDYCYGCSRAPGE